MFTRAHLLTILLVLPAVAGAQTQTSPTSPTRTARDTALVAPVVVTATRSPLSADRSPASITVLTGVQLRSQGIATVADALRQVPGVTLAQTGSYGGATSLFMRGGESKFTKVLIDGVPVNQAGGAFDFSTLTTDNIDRIEIVRGPASVLYGSDAVAGVVQLFTRRGAGASHGTVSARGGRYGSFDGDASMRGGSALVDYSVGGARHQTDGLSAFNSGYRDNVGSALFGVANGAADARLAMHYDDAAYHYPTDGSGQVVDSNAVHREDRLVVGLDAGYRLTSAAQLRFSLASNRSHGITDDQPDSPGDSSGYYFTTAERSYRTSGDLRLDLELPADTRLTVGAQVERKWQESGTVDNFGGTPTYNSTRRSTGSYAQLLLAPSAATTLALGGRFEHNEQFGDFFTYRTAGSVQLSPATRLRASVGTSFREPTFLESYGGGFVNGNRSLQAEHAFSIDAGIEQQVADQLSVGATYFNNSFRDLIDYQYQPSGGPDYFNIARTRASGLELEGHAVLPAGFHADVASTYLDSRVVDPGKGTGNTALFVAGARLLRRPMHTLDAGVGFRGSHGSLDLRALRVGTREDNYFAPGASTGSHVTMPAYTRVDLSGELPVAGAQSGRGLVILTMRAENLFDANYADVAGFNYDFSQTDAASIRATGYRAPGRRVLAGVRIGF
jgi:vitamin B12 transporter